MSFEDEHEFVDKLKEHDHVFALDLSYVGRSSKTKLKLRESKTYLFERSDARLHRRGMP